MSIWDIIFYISSTVSILGLLTYMILTVLIHLEEEPPEREA